MLQYTFMQRALLVGLLIGILAPTIGTFLVLRRFAVIGDTLAHVSLAGVLIGLFLGFSPLPAALILVITMTFLLEKLRQTFRDYAELSLALIISASLGITALLINITKSSDNSIAALLFGSILTLNHQDLWIMIPLALLTLFFLFIWRHKFFYLIFDETGARLAGLPVKFYNYLLLLLTALVITIGLKIVGALLIASLMVIPVATALLLDLGFKKTLTSAVISGVISVLLGLTISFYGDLAPGGSIILTSLALFLLVLMGKKIRVCFKQHP